MEEVITKELKDAATYLRVSGILSTLPERISYAKSKKLAHQEFLELIFSDEHERREAKALNVKMKRAGVSGLSSYDWNTSTKYDRELAKRLFNLAFIEKHASIIIFGPTGVGNYRKFLFMERFPKKCTISLHQ